MAARNGGFRLEEMAQQWLNLAERRLAYYRELYLSGRWTHYFQNSEQFAARMVDVIKAANRFRKLVNEPAAPMALEPLGTPSPKLANDAQPTG